MKIQNNIGFLIVRKYYFIVFLLLILNVMYLDRW